MDPRLVDTMDPGSIPSPWDRMDMRTARVICLTDGVLSKGWKIGQNYTVPDGHVGVIFDIMQAIHAPLESFGSFKHPLSQYDDVDAKIYVGGRQLLLFNSDGGGTAHLIPRIEVLNTTPQPGSLGSGFARYVEVHWPLPRPGILLMEKEVVRVSSGPTNWLDASFEGHHAVSILIAQPVSLVRWLEYAMPRRASIGLPGAEVRGDAQE